MNEAIQDFMRRLKATGYEFKMDSKEERLPGELKPIRTTLITDGKPMVYCPITALCKFEREVVRHIDEYYDASVEIDLGDLIVLPIVIAADGDEDCDPEIRQELESLCLQEVMA